MSTYTPEWLCRRIVEDSPDAIIFADRDGLIRLWNRGAEALFGYSAAQALGHGLDLIIPENLRARHTEGYRRVMAQGSTKYSRELLAVPALHRDGSRRSVEFTILLVQSEAGETLGTAAIIRDVTRRRQKDQEQRRHLAALEARLAVLEKG